MRKRSVIAMVAAALVVGLVAGSYGLASAASTASTTGAKTTAASVSTSGTAGPHGRGGPGGGHGGGGRGGSDLVRVVSKLTGESTATVLAARDTTGTSLASIAAKKSVTVEQIVTLAMASHQASVASELKNGLLTQTEATQILAQLKERITAEVKSTEAPRGHGGAEGKGGRGDHGGPPPADAAAPAPGQ